MGVSRALRGNDGGADGGGECARSARNPSSIRPIRLPALIANNYGEMMSVPLYDSALLAAALVLLLLVFAFNLLARAALHYAIRRAA